MKPYAMKVSDPGLPAVIVPLKDVVNGYKAGVVSFGAYTAQLPELHKLIAALEVLIDNDIVEHRRLKLAVIRVLVDVPRHEVKQVPAKLGLRVLHTFLHTEGPEAAIAYVEGITEPCRWSDIIRVYEPDYAKGNVTTLKEHGNKVKQRTLTVGYKPRKSRAVAAKATMDDKDPVTIGAWRNYLDRLIIELARVEHVVDGMQGLPDHRTVPPELIIAARKVAMNMASQLERDSPKVRSE